MKTKFLLHSTLLTTIFFTWSCVKKIDPNIRVTKPKLVVEGGINTDTVAYKVRLSYSGDFSNSGSFSIVTENQAQVSIVDNLGNAINLAAVGDGYYTTTGNTYIGKVGRSYQLKISLPSGEKYESVPENIVAPVPIAGIDSIANDRTFSVLNPTSVAVYIKTNDPANTTNFYRWSGSGWFPRKATGVPCGAFCIRGEYCTQFKDYNAFTINSDAGINGNQLIKQEAFKSPIYWYGLHYIDLKQHSISREAFLFWKKLQDQRIRTGTTTDPLPSAVEGNVYKVNNPTELALGYFEASSISHYKAILRAISLSPVFLSETATLFIGSGDCYLIYPNAIDNGLIPLGWTGAPEFSF
jgi:Domain of unknown function (DUF4249)